MDYVSGYHLLFSNPKLVKELLSHFIPGQWVRQLTFSSLEKVNAKFHSDRYNRREGDIIYLLLLHDSTPMYLYLLLQHLVDKGDITQKAGLPPVFPLVL